LHQELKCLRKVALRLGELQDNRSWRVRARHEGVAARRPLFRSIDRR
jgi:hypothetical protein